MRALSLALVVVGLAACTDQEALTIVIPSSYFEDLATYDKKRGTTNLLGFTATGVGVAAIGLGTASLFVSGRF